MTTTIMEDRVTNVFNKRQSSREPVISRRNSDCSSSFSNIKKDLSNSGINLTDRKEMVSNNNVLKCSTDKLCSGVDCESTNDDKNLNFELIDLGKDENVLSNKNAFQNKRWKECRTENLSQDALGNANENIKRTHSRKTVHDLRSFSLEELKLLAEDLASNVKEVSSELVDLLQENDMLQQESDARNIAIEQLLKLTVKQTETEIRPIQMSVIIPAVSNDEWD